ncbi:hypothetical protein BDF22DRAFT_670748 [Syncephalis plumigaleata]|nr:hypothetical protein BDF22DRAFT_670748 [Syncephalis plumigaleata]
MTFDRRKIGTLKCFPTAEHYLNHYTIYEGRNLVGTLPKKNKVPHFPSNANGAWREAYPPVFNDQLNGYLVDDAPYHDLNFPDFPFLYVEIEATNDQYYIKCLSDSPSITYGNEDEELVVNTRYKLDDRAILYFADFKCEFMAGEVINPVTTTTTTTTTPLLTYIDPTINYDDDQDREDSNDDRETERERVGNVAISQSEYNLATHALLKSQGSQYDIATSQNDAVIERRNKLNATSLALAIDDAINDVMDERTVATATHQQANTRQYDPVASSLLRDIPSDDASFASTLIIDRSDEEYWLNEDISLPSQFASSHLASLHHTELNEAIEKKEQQQQQWNQEENEHVSSNRATNIDSAESSSYPTIRSFDNSPTSFYNMYHAHSPKFSQYSCIDDDILLPSLQTEVMETMDTGKIDTMLSTKKPISKSDINIKEPNNKSSDNNNTSNSINMKSDQWINFKHSPQHQQEQQQQQQHRWASEQAVESWAKNVPLDVEHVETPEINSQSTDEPASQDRFDHDERERASSGSVVERQYFTVLPAPGEESALQYLQRQRVAKLNRFIQKESRKRQASSSTSSLDKAPAIIDHPSSIDNSNSNNNNDDTNSVAASNDKHEHDHDKREKKKHKRNKHGRRIYDAEVFRNLMSQASLKSTLIKAATFGPKSSHTQNPLASKRGLADKVRKRSGTFGSNRFKPS